MLDAKEIREARTHKAGRARDIAEALGLPEAALVAAQVGHDAVALRPHPNDLIPALGALGPMMALTRNDACVIEKDGEYTDYHGGDHATMTLNEGIDLRMFPRHWVHAFAVSEQVKSGLRHSVQVFDAAGDAVHKAYLRDGADMAAWTRLQSDLALPAQTDTLALKDREPPEGARINLDKRDILLKEWARLTDTHQFLRLCAKLKMNRLGAYRIAEPPFVRPLAPSAVDTMLRAIQVAGFEIMLFVGNRGCIEIHTGPLRRIEPMGPWVNVLDPDFNLHLRGDKVAEVWQVEKPTQRGPAVSVEAFDADGVLILQAFGVPKEGKDTRTAFTEIVNGLPTQETTA
ncbi:hemin-degrading factor [Dinoroseobacter sp. PD6]|uniref:hemin-degrading factor n=1 Tax=Dinoroseobacter sp. PD6 TaxID=3028384 RepID=UPI00237B4936|nr:ChuX/HutX family heme-like substrate-binding protein [Dinoroseobacter sp. PD6]MDD9717527.1 hemin-degrading factor [Dinoroseobacter sp. PD6]